MTLTAIIGFAAAMLVLAISPGPGVFATVARALASGFRASLAVICGIVLGDIVFLMLAVFGLSVLARALGDLFVIIKICGGAYLVFLGIRIWMSRPEAGRIEAARESGAFRSNFSGGLLITLSNPKVILFYGGFLPTFMDLSALTLTDLAVVVSIVVVVLSGTMSFYAFLAGHARRMFRNPGTLRKFNLAGGGVMITTGIVIAARS